MLKKSSFFIILIFTFACSSSQSVSDPSNSNKEETQQSTSEQSTSPPSASSNNSYLDQYRNSLSDTYTNRSNNIPQEYERIKVEDDSEETDLFEGYRVQIYSGQNVALADTIASIFRAWSDTTIVGYQADTYTFFKAPYYRVHVGDFHKRDRAIYFSNLLKRRFRDAWVVYDRIDPYKIPSDTTDIYSN